MQEILGFAEALELQAAVHLRSVGSKSLQTVLNPVESAVYS